MLFVYGKREDRSICTRILVNADRFDSQSGRFLLAEGDWLMLCKRFIIRKLAKSSNLSTDSATLVVDHLLIYAMLTAYVMAITAIAKL